MSKLRPPGTPWFDAARRIVALGIIVLFAFDRRDIPPGWLTLLFGMLGLEAIMEGLRRGRRDDERDDNGGEAEPAVAPAAD